MQLVRSGDFPYSNLTDWTAVDATFVPDDGGAELGCCEIASGGYIEQLVIIPQPAVYTLSIAHRTAAAATLTATLVNQDGDTVLTLTDVSAASWDTYSTTAALPAAPLTLRISGGAGVIRVDDVSAAHIPASRAQLATLAHQELGALATEFALSYDAAVDRSEGDYTLAVTRALEARGAVDAYGNADVRELAATDVENVVDVIVYAMLSRLHNEAMLRPTSSTTGPVTDTFSLLGAIEKRLGILPGQGPQRSSRIKVTRLDHKVWG